MKLGRKLYFYTNRIVMDRAASLRDKLHHYIDVADEQKLQAIYVLLEEEIDWQYTAEDIAEFHHRRQQHIAGSTQSYTVEESLNAIRQQKK